MTFSNTLTPVQRGLLHNSQLTVPGQTMHVSTNVGGLATLIIVLIGLIGLVVVLGVVGSLVIVIVANRADPDPSGRRPMTVYLFGVAFVTLLLAVMGSITVVWALVQLISPHASGDAVARAAVLGGLITVVSLLIMVVHLRRGLRFAVADGTTGPSQRVARSYVAAVAFLAVLLLLVAAVAAVYLLLAVIGPGVFGPGGGRTPSVEGLIVAVFSAAVALLLLQTHRNLVSPGLRFRREPPPPRPAGPPTTGGSV